MGGGVVTLDSCVSRRMLEDVELITICCGRLAMPARSSWIDYESSDGSDPADLLDCVTLVARSEDQIVVIDPSAFDEPGLALAAHYGLSGEKLCDLDDALAHVGISADEVTKVIVTHGHFDHFTGVGDGTAVRFAHAEHYIPEVDWLALDDPSQPPLRATFGPVEAAGLLRPISGNVELLGDVSYLDAPGESAGHHVVRVGPAWWLGDLVHYGFEVEHPDWRPHHVDAETIHAARQKIFAAAQGAVVGFSHYPFPAWGTIERAGDGWRFISDTSA